MQKSRLGARAYSINNADVKKDRKFLNFFLVIDPNFFFPGFYFPDFLLVSRGVHIFFSVIFVLTSVLVMKIFAKLNKISSKIFTGSASHLPS